MLSPFFSTMLVLMSCCCYLTSAKICSNPAFYEGKSVCDISGKYCCECVSFVKICSGDNGRTTSQWKKGIKVRGNQIPVGTAIATFLGNGGTSFQSGHGHAAIYISQNSTGINVWDQYQNTGQPCKKVGKRFLPFDSRYTSSNNGDYFYVIG